jgi:hypothetical protein
LDDRLLLYLVVAIIFVLTAVRTFFNYNKLRTKHSLAVFISIILLLTATILSYLYQGKLYPGNLLKYSLLAFFIVILIFFWNFPGLQRYFHRKQNRK